MEQIYQGELEALRKFSEHESQVLIQRSAPVLPAVEDVVEAEKAIHTELPEAGLGTDNVTTHLLNDIAKGLNRSSLSPYYYGFVTGGAAPEARVADHLVTLYDQNVAVHLPNETIATTIESRALEMLLQLLRLDHQTWPARILTTGATASNILGLASGRQWVIEKQLSRKNLGEDGGSVELGMLKACRLAEIDDWQVLTTAPHSSLRKAANIVGLGNSQIIDVGDETCQHSITFDLTKLEHHLSQSRIGSIVVISCGEVNTGWFATHSKGEVQRIRDLCDRYGAWLHVDGAFGLFARLLDAEMPCYTRIAGGADGMELADSITGDGHKMLNVPKHLKLQQRVFQNPNAPYLTSSAGEIPSPLNIGLENSRRFRGLPLYATLVANGRHGYTRMIERQVDLARAVAKWLAAHEEFNLLQHFSDESTNWQYDIYMIVLFQARDSAKNEALVSRINRSRRIYVSSTIWRAKKAARIAIANWQANEIEDMKVITEALEDAIREE